MARLIHTPHDIPHGSNGIVEIERCMSLQEAVRLCIPITELSAE
jgi:hypothetical protein